MAKKTYTPRAKKGQKTITNPETNTQSNVTVSYEEKVLRQRISHQQSPTAPDNKMDEIDLDKQHASYDILDPHWDRLYDCFIGGGNVQNADDDVYLIKKANEPQKKYDQRKKEAVYYNKPAQVITTFQSHIWRKEPERILPAQLERYKGNVDRMGKSANKFFSFVTKMAQVLGVYYVLAEYPENPFVKNAEDTEKAKKELAKVTQADEQALNLRPYFCPIDPRNILDWGWREKIDGSKELSYVIIREKKVIENIPFLEAKYQVQYRIIWPGKQVIYTYKELPGNKKEIIKLGEKLISINTIPLVPFYSEEIDWGIGKSAIFDIAELALEFYNKHSDRQHAEVMSAFPFLFLKGFTDKEKLVISEEMAIITENDKADGKWMEFTGNSIEALRESEKMIISEIFDLAMKQVRPSTSARQTAEAKKLDRLDSLSDIQTRAISFSNSEQQCWEFAALWEKLDYRKDEDIKVSYNLDFDIKEIESDLIKALLDMRMTKDLSRDTLWEILSRGEILPRNFNKEEEEAKIADEEAKDIELNAQKEAEIRALVEKEKNKGEEEFIEEEE